MMVETVGRAQLALACQFSAGYRSRLPHELDEQTDVDVAKK